MRARVAATAVLATGLLLGSTGCAFISPQATLLPYDPSDGVSATVGDIKVRNAMAITEDGGNVNLVMVVLNSGTESAVVQFEYDFEGTSDSSNIAVVGAGESISFGNTGQPQFVLENADVELGTLMPVFVQYGEETGATMLVPVLDNTLQGYEDLLPSPVPTPTGTSTAAPVTE